MKFAYEDLISGDSIPVPAVGHIRSPYLYELKPTQGIGMGTYNFYLNILSWDRDELIQFMRLLSGRPLGALTKHDTLPTFDTITILEQPRELLQKVMAFFMDEDLIWNEEKRAFATVTKGTREIVGSIDRKNFDELRDMMLQVNYINVGRSAKPTRYASKEAQALWEKAQVYLKKEAKKKSTPDKRMQIGNIISKLCSAGIGYTLLNIYNLTVFQLYDQFFQYGYLRATGISEMAFCNHGGKNFDIQGWLKPITNM